MLCNTCTPKDKAKMCHRDNSAAAKDDIPCIKRPCTLVCDIILDPCFVIPALLKTRQKMCHRANSVAAKDITPCIKCPGILVFNIIIINLCFVIPALLKTRQKCVLRANSAAAIISPCVRCCCILTFSIIIGLWIVIPALLKTRQTCVTEIMVLQLGYHQPLYQTPLRPCLWHHLRSMLCNTCTPKDKAKNVSQS